MRVRLWIVYKFTDNYFCLWICLRIHSNWKEVSSQWTHLHRFAIDSTSKFHVESSWKLHRFERRIHVEIMTSIRRGNFDVDSTFKIDKISMGFPRGFFYVVSTLNRCNFFTCCFHCIIPLYHCIIVHFLLWEPILSYSGIVLSPCNFNNIDVITDIGTIGTISCGNICNNANK